jgi:hypothetical protein
VIEEPVEEVEKYRWIIMFQEEGKLYTYLWRTKAHMADVLKKHYDEHASYPYKIWVVVDDEMHKVVIA